jgi:tellurite resistance protein
MVSKTINRTDQQREVLRIATFLAFASGGVSDAELDVIEKMSRAFEIDDAEMQSVLKEVKQAIDEAQG